jgi:regulator of vacuolar morphogenesis
MVPPLEISIPTTSLQTPADGSKPYTLYNITLRLPLRSFVVQKRYSDFAALHNALTSLVGSPPPEPLPSKSWFRSTVSSPALTEQRRVGLERYLRAIAEPPDRRWRDTPAWRAFLNLPSGAGASVSGVSVDGRAQPVVGTRDATLAAASDPARWVDLREELREALKEANWVLSQNQDAKEPAERRAAAANARMALLKAGNLLLALREGLNNMKKEGRLGEGEFVRRKDFLDVASKQRDDFERIVSDFAVKGLSGGGGSASGVASESDRAKLGVGGVRRPVGRTIGRPLPETERTRELDNTGVLQMQKEDMREQDERVNEIGSTVQRLKTHAIAINDEITYQLGQLDLAKEGADSLERKLAVANRRAKQL